MLNWIQHRENKKKRPQSQSWSEEIPAIIYVLKNNQGFQLFVIQDAVE
jgi:hypothetical protein